MYRIICLGIIQMLAGAIFAQNCDTFDISTFKHTIDRDNYPDNWDWRNDEISNWSAHIRKENGSIFREMPFPFRPQGQTLEVNTSHLDVGQAFDYEPSDGWELVFRAFGDGPSFAKAVDYPTVVLYNRFTGILRVFIWVEFKEQIISDAAILVRFQKSIEKASSLLSLLENPTSPLERFNPDLKSVTPNIWQQGQVGLWLFSDLPVSYDPCTCLSSLDNGGISISPNISEVSLQGRLIQSYNIVGKTGSNLPETINPKSNVNASWNDGIKTVENGSKFFKSVLELTSTVEKINKENTASVKKGADSNTKTPIEKEAEALYDFKIPTFLKCYLKSAQFSLPWMP